jgi:hypothetical protein
MLQNSKTRPLWSHAMLKGILQQGPRKTCNSVSAVIIRDAKVVRTIFAQELARGANYDGSPLSLEIHYLNIKKAASTESGF